MAPNMIAQVDEGRPNTVDWTPNFVIIGMIIIRKTLDLYEFFHGNVLNDSFFGLYVLS